MVEPTADHVGTGAVTSKGDARLVATNTGNVVLDSVEGENDVANGKVGVTGLGSGRRSKHAKSAETGVRFIVMVAYRYWGTTTTLPALTKAEPSRPGAEAEP